MSTSGPLVVTLQRLIPNLRANAAGTDYEAHSDINTYRMVINMRIYFTEPGKRKMLVRAEYPHNGTQLVDLRPRDVKIIHWGVAP